MKKIYESYLKLISTKAQEVCKKLDNEEIIDKDDMYYNKGEYCFYLRYLGKYYINHNAYLKWKSRTSRR